MDLVDIFDADISDGISFVKLRLQIIRIQFNPWSKWLAHRYLEELLLLQGALVALELALLWSSLGVAQR